MSTDVVRTYYDDDEHTILYEEYFQVNGKKEGEYKSYHENGNLCWICTYINDKEEGISKTYYDTGEISFICYYVDGKENGEYKCYYKNGCELSEDANLKSSLDDFLPQNKDLQIFSSDNSKRKNMSSTDSFGQLEKIVTFIDNKLNGEYKSYYENGQIKCICNYVNDKREGECKEYQSTGECVIDTYVNGIKQ